MADGAISRGASPNLDLLRSLAVLLVLVDHLCRHFYRDHWGRFGIADLGTFGVLLFFVHTSLVLMYSMQRSRLSGLLLMRNFFVRRCFRIYPLSVLAVLSAVALHLHANGRGLSFSARPGPVELASNLLLVQNLTYSDSVVGPLWSLPIELQMYVLLPFLFLWRKRSLGKLLVIWMLAGILGHFPLAFPALGWFTLLLYIPNFIPGVMAYDLPESRTLPSYLWPPFILLLGGMYAFDPSRRFGAELCLLLGLMIPRFREITFHPVQLVSHWIATYSYGIYLAHSFCIWFALGVVHSWGLFVVMIVVLPVALYHGIEHPAIKIGTRMANRISSPQLPEAVPAAVQG
ncbi:MAG: acyltransferase family protein [Terriglobales bacterium]